MQRRGGEGEEQKRDEETVKKQQAALPEGTAQTEQRSHVEK